MLLLGLLLMCATGAFAGLLIADNLSGGPDYQVTVLGNTIATMNSLAIFLAGIALALIFCLALAMTGLGGRMAGRRRAMVRDLRRSGAHRATPDATAAAAAPAATATPAATTAAPVMTPPGSTTAAASDEESPTLTGAATGSTGRGHRQHRHIFGH
jgi:uncharacterized RDD family membrane protein YckC